MPPMRNARKPKSFQIYQDPKERRAELAESLLQIRVELSPQEMICNSDGSMYYWAEVTASCSGGPFLRSACSPVDSVPSSEFVKHFLTAICPGTAFSYLRIEEKLEKSCSGQPQCPCKLFLCSSIARHSSWVTALSKGDNVMTPEHSSLYYQFISRSVELLKMPEQEREMSDIRELVGLEKKLTQVLFKAWPILLKKSIKFNASLISEIDRKIPNWAKYEGIPCIVPEYSIKRWKGDLQELRKHIYTMIPRNWIYLDAQISTLESNDPQRKTYKDLQASVIKRWLDACIAANNTIIKLYMNTTKIYTNDFFDSQKEIVNFWRFEIIKTLETRWFEATSFWGNFEKPFDTEDWYIQRWKEIRELDWRREDYLGIARARLRDEERVLERMNRSRGQAEWAFGDPSCDAENRHYSLRESHDGTTEA